MSHSCRNCEGIQPSTCLFNPERVVQDSQPEPRADCDCIGERHTAECIQGRSGDHGDGLRQEHKEPAVDDSDECARCGTPIAEHPEDVECGAIQEQEARTVDDSGPSEDFEAGAEAMRKACWMVTAEVLIRFGFGREEEVLRRALKAAIEGATP